MNEDDSPHKFGEAVDRWITREDPNLEQDVEEENGNDVKCDMCGKKIEQKEFLCGECKQLRNEEEDLRFCPLRSPNEEPCTSGCTFFNEEIDACIIKKGLEIIIEQTKAKKE